jgi:hypothetical protein
MSSADRLLRALRPSRTTVAILLACLLPLALAAYVGDRPPSAVWLHAPGWSRARVVGRTEIDAAVPIALDDTGSIFLLLADEAAGRPRVVGLARDTQIRWERPLDIPGDELAQPRLLWDGQTLRVFGLADGRLFQASLDRSGQVLDGPSALATPAPVETYAVAADTRGRVALWYGGSRAAPGVYAAPLGEPLAAATLIDPAGYRPALRFGGDGTLYAIWSSAGQPNGTLVSYSAYADGEPPGEPQRLTTIEAPSIDSELDGPWLGADAGQGYLFWTIRRTSGMNAGRRVSQYLAFSLGGPAQAAEARPLVVPDGAELAYDLPPGAGLDSGPRAALAASVESGGTAPAEIETNPVFQPELALAGVAPVRYKYHQTYSQVGLLFARDGQPSEYQLLSFNGSSAFTPALISDSSRYLYVTWRELHGGGADVYFASTAPDIVQALADWTLDDAARIASDAVFGMLSGAIFTPFAALLWLAAPLAILGLTAFTRREGSGMERWGTRAGLALALAAYWTAKLFTFRDALGYVPFAAWLPSLPPWLALPLRIGVPALIALGALRLAWNYTYGVGRRSAVFFMLIYAGLDSLLTMAIYGGLLFDAFYPHAGGG